MRRKPITDLLNILLNWYRSAGYKKRDAPAREAHDCHIGNQVCMMPLKIFVEIAAILGVAIFIFAEIKTIK